MHKSFIGKHERKETLKWLSCRWEDNIRMDLNGTRVGRCGLDASG